MGKMYVCKLFAFCVAVDRNIGDWFTTKAGCLTGSGMRECTILGDENTIKACVNQSVYVLNT